MHYNIAILPQVVINYFLGQFDEAINICWNIIILNGEVESLDASLLALFKLILNGKLLHFKVLHH
jgi:hypothetical protein